MIAVGESINIHACMCIRKKRYVHENASARNSQFREWIHIESSPDSRGRLEANRATGLPK